MLVFAAGFAAGRAFDGNDANLTLAQAPILPATPLRTLPDAIDFEMIETTQFLLWTSLP